MKITRNVMTVSDLYNQLEEKSLFINRKYQRQGGLWPSNARSFFIDTILKEFTFPKITIRQTINLDNKKSIREVVDGQQRLLTIRDFINNNLKLSKVSKDFAGNTFETLDDTEKEQFLAYEVSIDTIVTGTEQDVLEIFRRMNSYTLPLNPQEQRHATYQGEFKWFIFDLVEKYSYFLEENKILSPKEVSRMKDADLLTEITQLFVDGITNRTKGKLDISYKNHDKQFDEEMKNKVINLLEFIKGNFYEVCELDKLTQYQFYSLCSALTYNKYGNEIYSYTGLTPQYEYCMDINEAKRGVTRLLSFLDEDNDIYIDDEIKNFINASNSTTHSLKNREIRFKWFLRAIQGELSY